MHRLLLSVALLRVSSITLLRVSSPIALLGPAIPIALLGPAVALLGPAVALLGPAIALVPALVPARVALRRRVSTISAAVCLLWVRGLAATATVLDVS